MSDMDEIYSYERLRSVNGPLDGGAGIGWMVFAIVLAAVTYALC
ncbi:hypothetical protein ACKTEK_11315 [Tepidamorphus sp. 3E244]